MWIPNETHEHKDSELTFTFERKHEIVVFLSLCHLAQINFSLYYTLTAKFRVLLFLTTE